MSQYYLLAYDFDGTLGKTFQKSPQGIGVSEAYQLSIRDIFGEAGEVIYRQIGLNNMAPGELIRTLLAHDTSGQLVESSRHYLEVNGERLRGYVDSPHPVPLVWDEKNPHLTITEVLVRQKIEYLLREVGSQFPNETSWPLYCEGLCDLWNRIDNLNKQGEGRFHIDRAIISSGHRIFIQRVMDLWQLKMPDILVSDDDLRWRQQGEKSSAQPSKWEKPQLGPIAYAHREWVQKLLKDSSGMSHGEVSRLSRSRMAYFGDHAEKDGCMAKNAGIPFGLFKNESILAGSTISERLVLNNWVGLATQLEQNIKLLCEGKDMQEVLGLATSNKENNQLHRMAQEGSPYRFRRHIEG